MNKRIACAGIGLDRTFPCAGPGRAPDRRGIAAPRPGRLPALRRLARSDQRQQQGDQEAWQSDRLGSYGDSKAIIRFTEPAEVKGVALLVVNHPDRSSDQWMWTPAIGRDRRIALQDRSTRFFGTDFSFEDLEERDVNQYDYNLQGEEAIDGAPCWRIESQPKQGKSSQYTSSRVWIRKDNYVPVAVRELRQRQTGAAPARRRTSRTSRASGPRACSK